MLLSVDVHYLFVGRKPSDGVQNSAISVLMFVVAALFDVISMSLCVAMVIAMLVFQAEQVSF